MDNEQATKILAKDLGNRFGRRVIRETLEKSELFENIPLRYQVANPVIVGYSNSKYTSGSEAKKDLVDILLLHDNFEDANYYFLDTNPILTKEQLDNYNFYFWVTPYAMIGDKEKEVLKNFYYKDLSLEVYQAMGALDIENFSEIYKAYKNCSGESFPDYDIICFLSLVDEECKVYDEIDTDYFRRMGGVIELNIKLANLGITNIKSRSRASKRPYYYASKNNLLEIAQQLKEKYFPSPFPQKSFLKFDSFFNHGQFMSFLNFIFHKMPYEDQDFESNKILFKEHQNKIGYRDILLKEYSEGKYFKDYFFCLDSDNQKEFVEYLEGKPCLNLDLNLFLWNMGFEDVFIDPIDPVDLCGNNVDGFIRYFKDKTKDEKKEILERLYRSDRSDFINREVIEWLDENEQELVRDIGLLEI